MKDSSQVRTTTVKSPTESTTSTLACGADRPTVEVTRQRRPRCPPPSVQTRTTSVAVCSSCVSMLATVAAGRHPVVTGWVPAVDELLDLGRGARCGLALRSARWRGQASEGARQSP